MRRSAAGIICACVLGLASVAPAHATTLSAKTADRDCASALGGKGADAVTFVAPGRGFATAELRGGPRGNWDLAAYRRGEAVGASTNFASDERVDLWAERGQRFVFQACRTDGGPVRVPLRI